MHMRIWEGNPAIVQQYVNDFMKGKALDKSVIIHTHYTETMFAGELRKTLTVVIFHAEDSPWMELTQ